MEGVLPPLGKEVHRPPEEGDTLRNRLVKLMTSVTEVANLAADFLYELCKRNVNRLIKYTGFGNAAGLLANYGLLGMRPSDGEEQSADEDSDTEDYENVRDKVNPVLGCVEEQRADPMAGMTQEQKEYEAEKLAQQIDKLMRMGTFQPATIGEDGRPRPVEHILELQQRANPPQLDQNQDEDSD